MDEIINTKWDNIPSLDKRAGPIKTRQIHNARAVRITVGSIRNADVSGVFELATNAVDPFTTYAGRRRVEVKCLWYQRKLPTTWMHLTITGTCEVLENYSGAVVSNIGR